jgi:hypothetical protein
MIGAATTAGAGFGFFLAMAGAVPSSDAATAVPSQKIPRIIRSLDLSRTKTP